MSWLKEESKVKNSVLVFGFLLFIIIILIWLYCTDFLVNPKWPAIISGLLTGFVVALFQTILSLRELQKLDKYDALKIVDILSTRDDPNYYRPLIQKAKEEIKIQGVTCKRFLDDFANGEKNAPDRNKVLLNALDNGLKVKILIAADSYLDEENKNRAIAAKSQLEELSIKYPKLFFYAFYEHEPRHSIMVIDRESIVGPVFPHVSSKFSPAIHLKNESKFVEHYLEYFENEWKRWGAVNKD
ncbi:MAG: hypothetical protein PHD65_08590 [Gallionella sp.]|nr:hypothetical protein [Gallionella sp.]